jgi:hypothetical protein
VGRKEATPRRKICRESRCGQFTLHIRDNLGKRHIPIGSTIGESHH